MKKSLSLGLSLILLFSLSHGLRAADVKVEFKMMAQGTTGNQRFPIIAENARGERMYVYRGSDRYAHYLLFKNGTWSKSGRVNGSPQFEDYWYSDIVADSTGTFHYVAEDADHFMFYAYFQNGAWSSMRKIEVRHEATLALGVRSDDTIVLVAPVVTSSEGSLTKDVLVGTKSKNATTFSNFKNVTNDAESSTMVDAAIDANDNTWIAYKASIVSGKEESLQAALTEVDKSNKHLFWKNVSGQEGAWCWYPRLAINSDGKIMVTWIVSQQQTYFYRLYDTETKKWNEPKAIMSGAVLPWPLMYNKLLARGTEFYWIGMTPTRVLQLFKYDAKKDEWSKMADVSNAGVNWFSACNAAGSILISWDRMGEPMSCFLTEVTADLPPIIRIQSPANLKIEKHIERGFFHGYTLNVLTWEANPLNTEQGITVAAYRVYRKARTADSSLWVKIAEVGADVFSYYDRSIPADSDYVYAVTSVDDKGVESPIIDEGQGATQAARAREGHIHAEPKDR